MNQFQNAWWIQVVSDHGILTLMRKNGAAPCHQLHYLQMVSEKLGKAYFWRTGKPPRPSHASFVDFLRALCGRSKSDREMIGKRFGFGSADSFKSWLFAILPLAYELEQLAPALAGLDKPNPEYPWPSDAPAFSPAAFAFPIWAKLTGSGSGHQLIRFVDDAVQSFPVYC